jgi:hypothetical protein
LEGLRIAAGFACFACDCHKGAKARSLFSRLPVLKKSKSRLGVVLFHTKTQRHQISFLVPEFSFENCCPSPDSSENPFVPGFGTKD